MKRDKHIYVGLDLHKFQHTAVILDCWFEKLGEMTFQNKPSIFPSLLEFVRRFLTKGLTPCRRCGRLRKGFSVLFD